MIMCPDTEHDMSDKMVKTISLFIISKSNVSVDNFKFCASG